MIRLHRYIPTFVEHRGELDAVATVENVAAMLALPWVASWKNDPRFHRFSYNDRNLMAEFDGGKVWHVVAVIEEGDVPAAELPDWKAPG